MMGSKRRLADGTFVDIPQAELDAKEARAAARAAAREAVNQRLVSAARALAPHSGPHNLASVADDLEAIKAYLRALRDLGDTPL